MRRFVIVDVFAEEKWAGNQLAVVLDCEGLGTEEMQRIARETNFSETTFVLSKQPSPKGYAVRIFTPAGEMPFAGHPTLGTAWVIRSELASQATTIDLDLKIGRVPVTFKPRADGADLAWLRSPDVSLQRVLDGATLAPVIGLAPVDLDSDLPVQEMSVGVNFTFIPVRHLEGVRRARFDRVAYDRVAHLGFHPSIFLFCREAIAAENHLHARLFADVFGIPEDPATGSANACLGRYLLEHLETDVVDVNVEQGYEINRPSLLRVKARRDAGAVTVEVGGRVILSARGELA